MNQTELIRWRAASRSAEISKEIKFREKLKVRQDPNNDTTIRMDIHAIMQKGVEAGKSKEEIIELLQEERFLKYSDFFESWIDDKMKKYKTVSKEER